VNVYIGIKLLIKQILNNDLLNLN